MIELIIQLLNSIEIDKPSEAVQIAKGKYKLPDTWKEEFKHIKKRKKWQ